MVVCLCLDRCQLSQRDPTGQRGAALEELSAASSFRTHQSLPSKNVMATKSRPRGREYTQPCQIWPVPSRGLLILQRQPGFAVFLSPGASEPIIRKPNQ